jgi:hypothetical protein
MAAKDKTEAPPKRRNWAAQMAPDALVAAHAAMTRAGFSDPSLILQWPKIAGAETARLARPLRLSQGPQGGVLTLQAEPAAAVFLQHDSRNLCERINRYFGQPVVARLRFVQAVLPQRPTPPPPSLPAAEIPSGDPVLSFNGPDGMREALCRLARARHNPR